MGFGSYDESEQQDQDVEADDSDGGNVHEHDHEGKVSFEADGSTDDLVDQCQTIKTASEE